MLKVLSAELEENDGFQLFDFLLNLAINIVIKAIEEALVHIL